MNLVGKDGDGRNLATAETRNVFTPRKVPARAWDRRRVCSDREKTSCEGLRTHDRLGGSVEERRGPEPYHKVSVENPIDAKGETLGAGVGPRCPGQIVARDRRWKFLPPKLTFPYVGWLGDHFPNAP